MTGPAAPAGPPVYGPTIDDHTRCIHYGTELDIVAIRFFCCGRYYPCHLCHAETAAHPAEQWPRARWHERAILCGDCKAEISIADYLEVTACPSCGAAFNEGCRLHSHLYFETGPGFESEPRPSV
ncbi:CHY zinc finger protein [Herbiconiux sp. P17]|uniref:CHY zinc finger protein n=1 Tax=Herbiconiux wuyangfengii TaxID=3342794 RepID=UPI0035B8C64D